MLSKSKNEKIDQIQNTQNLTYYLNHHYIYKMVNIFTKNVQNKHTTKGI